MLYVIHGNDTAKARKKLTELVDGLQKKQPDALYFRMNSENWSPAYFEEVLQGQGLFMPKYIIVLDQLLVVTDSESAQIVQDKIADLASAEHICIIIEEKIKAADKKLLDKHAQKVQEYPLAEAKKKEFPIVFNLTDALIQKKYKDAWIVFQQIRREELAAEEVHGAMWWQFKSLLVSKQAKTAAASGLSPYVYQKSSRAAEVWTESEISSTLDKLFLMYNRAHRGELDFMMELERFTLGR